MRIAALSDTHSPRFWKGCPPAVAKYLINVDAIFHAGDVCTSSVLDELKHFALVYVAMGNNDGPDVAEWGAAETVVVTLDGVRFVIVHDSAASTGRMKRMQKRFPDTDCVVFGHSHIPINEVSDDGTFRIFNPGSPTDKRRQPHKTLGLLNIDDGRIVSAEIVICD